MIYNRLIVINLLYILMAVNVNSAEYLFVPAITFATTYTDNVFLQQEKHRQSDIIYEIGPQFDFTMEGKRMDVYATYIMQALEYDTSDGDTINHKVNAKTNIEVVEDNIFLDSYIARDQSYIDYNKPVAQDDYTQTDNRTDVTSYSVTPRFQSRLWNGASIDAKKTFTRIEYDDQTAKKLEKEDSSLVVKSTLLGGDMTLGINYIESKDKSIKFTSIKKFLSVHYNLTPRLLTFAEGGTEINNRETPLAKQNADYYRIGTSWKPNNRSKFDAAYGEGALGSTSSLEAVFTSKTKTIGVNYDKEVTSTVDIYAEQNKKVNSNQLADLSQSGLSDRLFISEKYEVFFTKKNPRTTFSLKYFTEKRGFEDEKNNENIDGRNLDWLWQMSTKTSFILAYADSIRRQEQSNAEYTIDTISLSMTNKVGRTGNASISYSKYTQELPYGFGKYETQIASVRLSFAF